MQSLADKIQVHDRDLLRAVSDAQCISILQSLDRQPRPVSEISSMCGISAGTVYRKLKILQKCGLLETSYVITKDGKKFLLYRSRVRNFTILFAGNKLEVKVVLDKSQSSPEGSPNSEQD